MAYLLGVLSGIVAKCLYDEKGRKAARLQLQVLVQQDTQTDQRVTSPASQGEGAGSDRAVAGQATGREEGLTEAAIRRMNRRETVFVSRAGECFHNDRECHAIAKVEVKVKRRCIHCS